MRKFFSFILSLFFAVSITHCNAAQDSSYEAKILWGKNHLAGHTSLTIEEIDRLIVEIVKRRVAGRMAYHLEFSYSPISELFFEVNIKESDGTLLYCNCEDIEKYWANHVRYCDAVMPSFSATAEWEKQHGSYLFWSPSLKADFFNEYGHLPFETELQFLMGHRSYEYPNASCVSFDVAQEKCQNVLIEKFNETEEKIKDFQISAAFETTGDKMIWSIDYYSLFAEDGTPMLCYSFDLSALDGRVMDGICCKNHELNADHALCYYTDIYELIFFDDGSYYINRNGN